MKRKDLTMLVVVLIVSVFFSLLAAKLVFGGADSQHAKVGVVDKISSSFPVDEVKPKYFNDKSIDPTQLIHIGESNEHPFVGGDDQQQ